MCQQLFIHLSQLQFLVQLGLVGAQLCNGLLKRMPALEAKLDGLDLDGLLGLTLMAAKLPRLAVGSLGSASSAENGTMPTVHASSPTLQGPTPLIASVGWWQREEEGRRGGGDLGAAGEANPRGVPGRTAALVPLRAASSSVWSGMRPGVAPPPPRSPSDTSSPGGDSGGAGGGGRSSSQITTHWPPCDRNEARSADR